MTTSMSAAERPCAASPRMKVSSRFMCQFGRVARFSSSRSGVRPGRKSSTGRNGLSCSTIRWIVISPRLKVVVICASGPGMRMARISAARQSGRLAAFVRGACRSGLAELAEGVAPRPLDHVLRAARELGAGKPGLDRVEIIDRDDAGALVGLVRRPEMAGVEGDRQHPGVELRVQDLDAAL